MKEPSMMDFAPKKPEPTTGFVAKEEREKARRYEIYQKEKGWNNFFKHLDPEDAEIAEMEAEEVARQERRLQSLIGTPEKIENLKRIKGMIDLKKIPRFKFEMLEVEEEDDKTEMWFVVSKELTQIADQIKKILSSRGEAHRILLTNGTTIPFPEECKFFKDCFENQMKPEDTKLIEKEDDYLDSNRAQMYLYIAENPELLELYAKEK